jgi:hypothetical protein
MSDTPETDKFCPFTTYDHAGQPYQSDLVPGDFARRLELERDEYKHRWQDWERWAKQMVQYSRRVPLDTDTVGMRNTLTRWMQEMKDQK